MPEVLEQSINLLADACADAIRGSYDVAWHRRGPGNWEAVNYNTMDRRPDPDFVFSGEFMGKRLDSSKIRRFVADVLAELEKP